MKAAIAAGIGEIRCDEVQIPELAENQALVRMSMASICGSDLHCVYSGWPRNNFPLEPGAPGHEGIGVIVDPGTTGFTEGQRVLTLPNIWESRNFAEYQALSSHFTLPVDGDTEPAHLMMAQQLGTVIYAARKLPKLNGETVVVIGQGSAGLFHDFWLRRMGAGKLITIEPNKERREAGRLFDVDDTIDVTGDAAVSAVTDLTDGKGPDLVVDCVGGYETLNQAVSMVRMDGYLHMFGLPNTFEKTPFDQSTFFLKHINMSTIFGAQDEPGLPAFRDAVDLIQRGEIDMAPFVTHAFPLEQVKEAFALAHEPSGGALKVSLEMAG